MSKLYNDISRMKKLIIVIEQYNNFGQLGAKEEVNFLKEKINNLINIKDTQELIKEFTWCAKMVNMFYNEIDIEFKKHIMKEEQDEFKEA